MSQNVDTLESGGGGLSQTTDILTLGREGVGELKYRVNIAVKCLNFLIN